MLNNTAYQNDHNDMVQKIHDFITKSVTKSAQTSQKTDAIYIFAGLGAIVVAYAVKWLITSTIHKLKKNKILPTQSDTQEQNNTNIYTTQQSPLQPSNFSISVENLTNNDFTISVIGTDITFSARENNSRTPQSHIEGVLATHADTTDVLGSQQSTLVLPGTKLKLSTCEISNSTRTTSNAAVTTKF